MNTYSYRQKELDKIENDPIYQSKIKIVSENGQTNWLNVTSVEMDQIKNILLDYRTK